MRHSILCLFLKWVFFRVWSFLLNPIYVHINIIILNLIHYVGFISPTWNTEHRIGMQIKKGIFWEIFWDVVRLRAKPLINLVSSYSWRLAFIGIENDLFLLSFEWDFLDFFRLICAYKWKFLQKCRIHLFFKQMVIIERSFLGHQRLRDHTFVVTAACAWFCGHHRSFYFYWYSQNTPSFSTLIGTLPRRSHSSF